jgi:predicted PurR-regulated permease PerM
VSNTAASPGPGGDRMPRWVPRAIALFWVGFLATIVLRFAFDQLHELLLLLLVSVFISFAVEPGVNRLSRRGWRRGTATVAILIGILAVAVAFLVTVGAVVGRQVADLLSNSQTYVSDVVDFLNNTFDTNIDADDVNDRINDPNGPVQEFIRNQQDKAFSLSLAALGGLLQVFSILLFSFYFVADGPRMRRAICSRLTPHRQRGVLDAWDLAVTKTGGYLYSRALLAGLSALFHWVAFQAIGIPAPIAMALWVGLVSQFLPVVGTYLAGVLPLLLSVLDSPFNALLVLVTIIVYQQVENYFFGPKVTERTMDLHPALAFGGAIAGAAILGPVGAVLALPGVAMSQALISAWGERHPLIDDPLINVQTREPRTLRRNRRAGETEDLG